MTTCYYHSASAVVGQCEKCGRFLCRNCFECREGGLCPDCDAAAARKEIKLFRNFVIAGLVLSLMTSIPLWLMPVLAVFTIIGGAYGFGAGAVGSRRIFRKLRGKRDFTPLLIFLVFGLVVPVAILFTVGIMYGTYATPFILYKAHKRLKRAKTAGMMSTTPNESSPAATPLTPVPVYDSIPEVSRFCIYCGKVLRGDEVCTSPACMEEVEPNPPSRLAVVMSSPAPDGDIMPTMRPVADAVPSPVAAGSKLKSTMRTLDHPIEKIDPGDVEETREFWSKANNFD